MALPKSLERSDWPLKIARPYQLLTPEPQLGQYGRVYKAFRTQEEREAWLVEHGYETMSNPGRRVRRRNPALGKVKSSVVSPNTTEVEHGEATVLYSYETPVAVFVPGAGVYVTDKFWSHTTSTHISKWINQRLGAGVTRRKVSQEQIEALAREGSERGAMSRRNPTLAILGNPVGDLPPWEGKPWRGLRVGQRIKFWNYAGRGMRGPEYKEVTGTVKIVNVDSVVVTLPGDKYGSRPVVVDESNINYPATARNPGRKKIARKVLAIDYVHASDGKKYTHDFTEDADHGPVCAYVEQGGRRVILEAQDGKPIVGDY
jgi:hypothetical protein